MYIYTSSRYVSTMAGAAKDNWSCYDDDNVFGSSITESVKGTQLKFGLTSQQHQPTVTLQGLTKLERSYALKEDSQQHVKAARIHRREAESDTVSDSLINLPHKNSGVTYPERQDTSVFSQQLFHSPSSHTCIWNDSQQLDTILEWRQYTGFRQQLIQYHCHGPSHWNHCSPQQQLDRSTRAARLVVPGVPVSPEQDTEPQQLIHSHLNHSWNDSQQLDTSASAGVASVLGEQDTVWQLSQDDDRRLSQLNAESTKLTDTSPSLPLSYILFALICLAFLFGILYVFFTYSEVVLFFMVYLYSNYWNVIKIIFILLFFLVLLL